MWQVKGRESEWNVAIDPYVVLVDYDGPRSFTFLLNGALHLAHWCAENEQVARFLIVPTNAETVADLVAGKMTFHKALLSHRRCIVADLSHGDWKVSRAWLAPFEDIPAEFLPHPEAKIAGASDGARPVIV